MHMIKRKKKPTGSHIYYLRVRSPTIRVNEEGEWSGIREGKLLSAARLNLPFVLFLTCPQLNLLFTFLLIVGRLCILSIKII